MSLFKTFKSNAKLETEGRWFDIKTPNEDGSIPGFLLARTGTRNISYQRAVEKIQRDHKIEFDTGTMAPDDALALLIETFVDTSLKDWRNVKDENEMLLPFNRPNAIKLFTDLPDLFSILRRQAESLSNYQAEDIKAAGGN